MNEINFAGQFVACHGGSLVGLTTLLFPKSPNAGRNYAETLMYRV
ncbi:hypothetical protein ACFOTA_21085 [Chitinophaga sp. GCM10012297]|nr:hypothetical protein [Chitinophaga chungangae]